LKRVVHIDQETIFVLQVFFNLRMLELSQ